MGAPVAKLSNIAKGANYSPAVNPGLINMRAAGAFYTNPTLVVGLVTRSGAGAYDVEVSILPSMQPITCTVACSTAASLIGVSECDMPVEGMMVIVLLGTDNSKSGVILGAYPDAERGMVERGIHVNNSMLDLEPGMSVATEQAYQIPQSDGSYPTTVTASSGRPLDIVPGNRAWLNEQGVGISILNLILLLRATDRARIELGLLDDSMKFISGYFRHLSSIGEEQIYNDGGMLTHELGVSLYQWEQSGFLALGTKLLAENGDGKVLKTSDQTRYKFVAGDPPVPRKRMQSFNGYLGDILNMFVANPDPDVPVDTVSRRAKDQGLLHTHVDSSGRLVIRSAAGISFQRADRIPVPKRMRQPWDPQGDKVENDKGKISGKKLPYAVEDTRKRSMLMRDANAYRNAQAYARIDGLKKDFYTPEEKDMQVPKDAYDPQGQAQEEYQKNANRQAYFNIEPDGSIVFRDAWGSEIIMRGGSIIFSCAGQMELRTGKSIVQIAGDDVVVKAKNSIDMTATDKDVRVKANKNMHLMSQGRGGGGGILLESKSTSETFSYSGKGEQVSSSGITLKAAKSRVLMNGARVHLAATNAIMVDGAGEDNKPKASMIVGGVRNFQVVAGNAVNIGAGGAAGLVIYPRTAVLAGRSVILSSGGGLSLLEGNRSWQPMMKVEMIHDFYAETMGPRFQENKQTYIDAIDWLGAYPPVQRATIVFTYRSSAECGTTQAAEVEGGTGFRVYQPAWAYMASVGSPFVPVQLARWKDYAAEYPDGEDTYPWPGKEAYEGTTYVKLVKEQYVDDPKLGIAKVRAQVYAAQGVPGETSEVKFEEYEIVNVV